MSSDIVTMVQRQGCQLCTESRQKHQRGIVQQITMTEIQHLNVSQILNDFHIANVCQKGVGDTDTSKIGQIVRDYFVCGWIAR